MKAAELQSRLAALTGGTPFVLTAQALGIAAVQELFAANLPDETLTLAAASGDAQAMIATGTMTLPGVGSGGKGLPATVSFTLDKAAAEVTGLKIAVTLDTWTVATAQLTVDAAFLKDFGVTAVRYALSAEPDPTGAIAPELGLEADVPFTTASGQKTITVAGESPISLGGGLGASNWSLEADLELPLTDLGSLASFGTGLEASAFHLPSEVPVLDQLALHSLRVIADASTGRVVVAAIDVKVLDSWPLVAGKVELSNGHVLFTVVSPTSSPHVLATMYATLVLGGTPISVSITVPELSVVASLDAPLPADAMFQQFLPGAHIPLAIAYASLAATVSTRWWQIQFGIDAGEPGGWDLGGGVSLTDVEVLLEGTGAAAPSGSIMATLALGESATVLLGGSYDATKGWTLEGNSVGTLDAGKALEDLASTFDVTLPAPLRQLELTSIGASVSTGPDCSFDCSGTFPLAGVKVEFTAHVAITYETASKGYASSATGTLKLKLASGTTLTFEVTFAEKDSETRFTALWNSTPVKLADVVEAFGIDASGVPSGLLPEVSEIALGYDTAGSTVVLTVVTADTASVWGVTSPASGVPTYAALVRADAGFRLSEVPIVGPQVPADDDVGIETVELLLASGALLPADTAHLNLLIPSKPSGLPAFPTAGVAGAEVGLTVAYKFGAVAQEPLKLLFGDEAPKALPPAPVGARTIGMPAVGDEPLRAPLATPATATAGPPTAWMKVQRTFGPVTLERVGASYAEGALWLLLDGSLHAGGLTLSLEGLGVGFALDAHPPFLPDVKLRGLGVAYDAPPLELAGALLFVTPTPPVTFEVAGLLSAGTSSFSLDAVGAYAATSKGPSMFVMGAAGGEFGGPPAFFVTGLAGGFGYQSALRIPEQGEVATFPLVQALADPAAFARKDPLQVLASIVEGPEAWVKFQPGGLWLAAGLQFSSFELVTTTAVLIGELGEDLTIALLGESTATFPQGATAGDACYAKVILELEAVFRPGEGSFVASALLAPGSFVIDPSCALTGGFAFALWFDPNPHAGDFVVTLGGYHPAFNPPAWYPREPRLGFTWSISDELTISGGAYFALTPSAVMAGGALNVAYHSGSLRAWLTAYADALIWFRPFHFSIDVGISVGASYTMSLFGVSKTFTVELGADLSLWGPPTAGTVTVHWWVIEFTVSFGEGGPLKREPLPWSEFVGLLPAAEHALRVIPVAAVEAPQGAPWVVSAYGFQFATSSVMPATELRAGSKSTWTHAGADALAIQPMQLDRVTAKHTVKVMLAGAEQPLEKWRFEASTQNVPKALWGTGDGSQLVDGEQQTIPDQPVGWSVVVPPPAEGPSPGAVADPQDLAGDPLADGPLPVGPGDAPSGPSASPDAESIALIQGSIGAAGSARSLLREALVELGAADASLPDDPLVSFPGIAGHAFSQPPLVVGK